MVIGMRSVNQPFQTLIGVVGFFLMWWVLLYLPFLQVQFAVENRWGRCSGCRPCDSSFQRAPWAYFMGLLATLGLAIPLYLLRIESLPDEFLWLPCAVFVIFTLPARMCVGWALNRARLRDSVRWWPMRYGAWILELAIVPIYILFLYLGSLATWDGVAIVLIQHAFLTPVPFYGP